MDGHPIYSSDQMITASDDKTIKIWAVNRQQFQASLIGHNNWVRTARFSPDTRMALSGGDDKVVKLWDLRTKQNMAEYYESTGQINAVRFHPSGNCVAAAGDDHSTRIWDIRTHKLLQHYSVSHQESVEWLVYLCPRIPDKIRSCTSPKSINSGTYCTSNFIIIPPIWKLVIIE